MMGLDKAIEVRIVGLDAMLALPRPFDRGIGMGWDMTGEDAMELVFEFGIEIGMGMGVRDGVTEERCPRLGESIGWWSRKCEIEGDTARLFALVGYGSKRSSTVRGE